MQARLGWPFLNDLQLGWLAGLLDGEGSFTIHRQTRQLRNGSVKVYEYPRVQLQMTDLDTIERAQAMIGGVVNGPYQQKGNRKPFYALSIPTKRGIEVMERVRPLMSARRAARIAEVLSVVS